MQHVNIKLFVRHGVSVHLADAIPVFHRWIQRGGLPELLIDVADYSHVPAGPGVVLIGHEANYSLDLVRNRTGVLYNRKLAGNADAAQALQQAYDAALAACHRLESEPEFSGKLAFDLDEVEVTWNDRLLHPNTAKGWAAVAPAVAVFFDALYGAGKYTMERATDPRERLRVNVRKVQA